MREKATEEALEASGERYRAEIVRDMADGLKAADELPGGAAEAAVNRLCDALADARALACSWMNDHGEP